MPRGLGRLEVPEDIIYLIFFHIRDARTAFRLGATNTRLMLIGERRIKQLMGDPDWTGDRLICLGAPDADSDDEWDEEEGDGGNDAGTRNDGGGEKKDEDNGSKDKEGESKGKDDGEDDNVDEDGDNGDGNGNGAHDDEENESNSNDLPDGLDLGGELKHFKPPAGSRWADIYRGLGSDLHFSMPEHRIASNLAIPVTASRGRSRPEIIWNLTKHVYVRADDIPDPSTAELLDPTHWQWGEWFNSGDARSDRVNILGWILLLHIIWTNSRLVHGDDFGDVFHGKWAGDRFEVTEMDVLETRLKETGCEWTDVSEEAGQLFIDVFTAMS